MLLDTKLVEESDLQQIQKALGAESSLFSQIADSCSNKLKYSIIARKQNDIAGFAVFEKLLWDTEHFGINIGRIKEIVSAGGYEEALAANDAMLKFIEKRCSQEGFSCVYCRVDINDSSSIHSLESNGFRMIDALITLRFDFTESITLQDLSKARDSIPEGGKVIVRPWGKGDLEELARIAGTSYEYDRFHSDPAFPRDKSDELHGRWIVNCCNGLADEVLVATSDKLRGFITCKINDSLGIIDMVGVLKDAQRKGIGTILVYEALQWFKDKVNCVDIGTQNRNIPALRLYINAGFKPISSRLTFHKWFTRPIPAFARTR
ncbi:MAG: dTDP-fucosamine acetyltransferase [Dehalococcoidia bacterium]|nr:dTDP-fucosamine acetyltransferase [Bacillota bacterium]